MKIEAENPNIQMGSDDPIIDPIYCRNYKATQRVLQKPQISQMASRLKRRLSLAITKVALGLEDYSIRQISAHLSSYHDASMTQPSQPAGRLAQPSNKAPIGVFHPPPSSEPNNNQFGNFDKSYFASNWDIENCIPQLNVPSNISDEVIFQFIHDH